MGSISPISWARLSFRGHSSLWKVSKDGGNISWRGIEAATKIETPYIAAPRSFRRGREHPLERSLEVKGGTALYPLRCTLLRAHVYASYTKLRGRGEGERKAVFFSALREANGLGWRMARE